MKDAGFFTQHTFFFYLVNDNDQLIHLELLFARSIRNKSQTASTFSCFYTLFCLSFIFPFNHIHLRPWKYFPHSQAVLRGILRNVAGGEKWEVRVEHGGENSHIDFPIMSWNSIFIDCLCRRGGGVVWGLLENSMMLVYSGQHRSAERWQLSSLDYRAAPSFQTAAYILWLVTMRTSQFFSSLYGR